MKLLTIVLDYFSQVINEVKKVSFPTLNQTVRRTVLVVISIIIGTMFLALADAGITGLVKLFILK